MIWCSHDCMTEMLIRHGVSDEIFVMGDLGVVLDVATLISRINATPRDELDIREGSTVDLIDIAQQNSFNPSKGVSTERMEDPILLLTLTARGQHHSRIVDGTHRLHARHRAGQLRTRFVAVKADMVRDLIRSQ